MKFNTVLLFLPFVLFALASCDNASSFKYSVDAQEINQIKMPGVSDFYIFSAGGQTKFGAKVDAWSNDSIDFRFVTNDPGVLGNKNTTGELLLNRKPMTTHRVAKADLIASKYNKMYSDNPPGKIFLPTLNNDQPLLVYDINRYPSIQDMKIYVEDTILERSVSNIIEQLTLPLSAEETIELIDSKSHLYFDNLLAIATSEYPAAARQYIQNANYPEAEYRILLYTKYVLLPSYNGKLPNSSKLLDQFTSLYRLISPGMWSQDFIGKEVNIESVHLTGLTTGVADLATNSNIIGEKQFSFQEEATPTNRRIVFRVHFHQEDGEWKINLPSTYSYLHRQLRVISHNPNQNLDKQTGTKGEQSYRELVRNEVLLSNPEAQIDPQLVY
ncbi:MAG: hypothetical protein AAFN81_27565 [Bacteroidota bacterium]